MAAIPGHVRDEVVVIGNHRDGERPSRHLCYSCLPCADRVGAWRVGPDQWDGCAA
jgi:hypothetical protein